MLDLRQHIGWQRVRVHLQSELDGRFRAESGADTAGFSAFDCRVQLQRAAPENLITEGIEAENVPALGDELYCVRGGGILL